jgi:ABC-2 type transport system permease protein
MKAFVKLLIANLKEFGRDRMALFWTLVFPVLFILIFGAIFSNPDSGSFNVGLVVEDALPAGEQLAQVFEEVPVFQVFRGDQETELEALRSGARRVVIIIPANLSAAVFQKQSATVEVYYDSSQFTTAQILLAIVDQVIDETDRLLTDSPRVLRIEQKPIQADRLRNIDFMVPGILAMALMQVGIFAAQPLVAMREKQILKRLGATPLSRTTLLASQVVLRLLIALMQTGVIVAVGRLLFDVQMVGSWLLLASLVILGALTFIGLGYMLASFARSEESSIALAQVIQFPMMFLAGIFWPVEIMPDFIRPVATVLPLTYLGDALRQVMVDAAPLYSLPVDAVVLGAWLIVCMILAVRFFRWEPGGA